MLTETKRELKRRRKHPGGDDSCTWVVKERKDYAAVACSSLLEMSNVVAVLEGLERIQIRAKVFSASEHLNQTTMEAWKAEATLVLTLHYCQHETRDGEAGGNTRVVSFASHQSHQLGWAAKLGDEKCLAVGNPGCNESTGETARRGGS